MTEQDDEFNIWKSKVELHLESMVKKSINELDVHYDLAYDFKMNMQPHETATRLIKKAYQSRGNKNVKI
jgi:hypothetical protein